MTNGDHDLASPRASIRGDIVLSLGHRRALFGNAAFDAPREACETVGEAFETPRVPFTQLVRSLTNLDEPLATSRASFAAGRVALMLRVLSWKLRDVLDHCARRRSH